MTPAGYSGTPLARKLGIEEGHQVATLGAPEGFAALLDPLPASVRMAAEPTDEGPYDVIVAFVRLKSHRRREIHPRAQNCGKKNSPLDFHDESIMNFFVTRVGKPFHE